MEEETKKHGYVKIMLNDYLGGGLDYQLNCLTNEAKKIGLKIEFIELKLKEKENGLKNQTITKYLMLDTNMDIFSLSLIRRKNIK